MESVITLKRTKETHWRATKEKIKKLRRLTGKFVEKQFAGKNEAAILEEIIQVGYHPASRDACHMELRIGNIRFTWTREARLKNSFLGYGSSKMQNWFATRYLQAFVVQKRSREPVHGRDGIPAEKIGRKSVVSWLSCSKSSPKSLNSSWGIFAKRSRKSGNEFIADQTAVEELLSDGKSPATVRSTQPSADWSAMLWFLALTFDVAANFFSFLTASSLLIQCHGITTKHRRANAPSGRVIDDVAEEEISSQTPSWMNRLKLQPLRNFTRKIALSTLPATTV